MIIFEKHIILINHDFLLGFLENVSLNIARNRKKNRRENVLPLIQDKIAKFMMQDPGRTRDVIALLSANF